MSGTGFGNGKHLALRFEGIRVRIGRFGGRLYPEC